MFGKDDYVFPNVNSQNISENIQAIEGILQQYGIDISLNFYVLANMRAYNDVISTEKLSLQPEVRHLFVSVS